MFNIDNREIQRLERQLTEVATRAIPYATRNTLNRVAFEARTQWQEEIRNEFTLRNTWTERAVRVERAQGFDVRRQESAVGSVAEYMDEQEFGGQKRPKGGKRVPIPTAYSAGEGRSGRRSRLPRRPNRMTAIQLRKPRGGAVSRKQRNWLEINSGKKYVYLKLQRRRGIFRVLGRGRGKRIEMVHDLTRRVTPIPATPTMQPAVDRATQRLPDFYRESLLFQLMRISRR